MQDKVSIDFLGKLDGKPFKGGQAQDVSYVLGSGQMIPEFDKLIVGMKRGEQKLDTITFPTDYPAKELSGKTVEFDIKVRIVEEGRLPKIDENFAKQFGIDDGSIEKLEKEVERQERRMAQDAGVDMSKYILKSEVVPPVCPKCPDSRTCPRQKPCPPCAPCARCPEPAFECKKVPNYRAATVNNVLPLPRLNSFSAFN